MICPSFTASDRAALEAERYLHPHPKVQRKMEAIYLKSLELPHHLICRICQISKPTLVRYLRVFEQEGLDGLKQLGYEGRPNSLHPHAASLEKHFRQNPPSTCAQTQPVMAAQIGAQRGLTQVRATPRPPGRRTFAPKPARRRGLFDVPEREGVFFLHEQALAGGDGVGVGFGVGHFIAGKLLVFLVARFEDGEFALGGERQQD